MKADIQRVRTQVNNIVARIRVVKRKAALHHRYKNYRIWSAKMQECKALKHKLFIVSAYLHLLLRIHGLTKVLLSSAQYKILLSAIPWSLRQAN